MSGWRFSSMMKQAPYLKLLEHWDLGKLYWLLQVEFYHFPQQLQKAISHMAIDNIQPLTISDFTAICYVCSWGNVSKRILKTDFEQIPTVYLAAGITW